MGGARNLRLAMGLLEVELLACVLLHCHRRQPCRSNGLQLCVERMQTQEAGMMVLTESLAMINHFKGGEHVTNPLKANSAPTNVHGALFGPDTSHPAL